MTKPLFLVLLIIFSVCAIGCKKDISGCTDPSSRNYNAEANIDDGSCEYLGCTDPASDNYNASANVDDGSCLYSGCMDEQATNYDPQANVDNGTCTYERDQFIGMYNGEEICVFEGIEEAYTWSMTISPSDSEDVSEVIIDNLGDFGVTMIGTVDGNDITYNYDEGGLLIYGTGTLNGDRMEFEYTSEVPAFGLKLICTGFAIRQ